MIDPTAPASTSRALGRGSACSCVLAALLLLPSCRSPGASLEAETWVSKYHVYSRRKSDTTSVLTPIAALVLRNSGRQAYVGDIQGIWHGFFVVRDEEGRPVPQSMSHYHSTLEEDVELRENEFIFATEFEVVDRFYFFEKGTYSISYLPHPLYERFAHLATDPAFFKVLQPSSPRTGGEYADTLKALSHVFGPDWQIVLEWEEGRRHILVFPAGTHPYEHARGLAIRICDETWGYQSIGSREYYELEVLGRPRRVYVECEDRRFWDRYRKAVLDILQR
jgi:hypothetical protein